MKIGVCGKPEKAVCAAEAGYDYIEPALRDVHDYEPEQFSEAKKALSSGGLKAEVLNCFFPKRFPLYEQKNEFFTEYAKKAFDRAVELGGQIAVLGSGDSRAIPEGASREDYEKRFCEIACLMGDEALKCGMKIGIEPLRREETNLINLLGESVAFCRKIHHPAVGTIVDFFHAYRNGDPLDCMDEAKPYLWHAHLARPQDDRGSPTAADAESIRPYAELLKKAGYTGRISLECKWIPDYETGIRIAAPVMNLFR